MQRLTLSILIVLALLGVASFWVVPPIPQPQLYHNFADQRSLSGIPNFWNVISNLPFLIIGGWGILYLSSGSAPDGLQDSTERWMFLFFFIAVAPLSSRLRLRLTREQRISIAPSRGMSAPNCMKSWTMPFFLSETLSAATH